MLTGQWQTVRCSGTLKGRKYIDCKMPYSNRVNVEVMYLSETLVFAYGEKNTVVERARNKLLLETGVFRDCHFMVAT